MLTFERVQSRPRVFQSLTGLPREAFHRLLPRFAQIYDQEQPQAKRQRRPGAGRKPTLRSMADKLLFILFYFRQYPTQETLAFFCGFSQGQACQWIHRLTPFLNTALGAEQHLPARPPADIQGVLAACPGLAFIIDGTERPIARPKDSQRRQDYYSGRRKRHTVKNIIITEKSSGKIKALGGTHPGRQHDKAAADEDHFLFPPGSQVWKDTGFQGYEPEQTTTFQPKRKPKGRDLSVEEKESNRGIARDRVGIEHSLGGVKIFRIVHAVFRNRVPSYVDRVLEVACGLFNFCRECRMATS